MAYNFQDIDPENIDFQQQSDDARKKRLAAAAAIMGGGSFADLMGQYATNKVGEATDKLATAQQAFQNPEDLVRQRLGIQAESQGPVMPQEIAQQRLPDQLPQQTIQAQQMPQIPVQPQPIEQPQVQPQAQPTPINPAQLTEQPVQVQLPQAGQPEVVAGPPQGTQGQPQVTEQPKLSWMDELAKAGNDTTQLAKFMSTTDNPEAKTAAGRLIAQQYNQQKQQQEAETYANKAVQSGDLLPLMKRIQQEKGEGSYIKAYLYQRLGLHELAKDEQQKLGAGTTYQVAYDQTGNKALMEVNANGLPLKGYNEKMQELTPEEFGKFAIGQQPKHAFQMPAVHGAPVTRTNPETGQVENGLMIYDPLTRTNYVQVGNQRKETTGWSSMAQNPELVAGAAAAKKGAELKTEGYTPSGPGATGGFSDPSIKVISGQRSAPEQQRLWDLSVANGTPGKLPNGNPVAKPGTSQHEGQGALDIDSKTLTRSGRQELASKGYYQPLPNDPNHWEVIPGFKPQVSTTPTVGQQKIAEKVAGERTQAFNKILDEEVRPQAQNGDTIVNTRKQQFAIFDRPGVDASRIFGIANGAGQPPGDQRWTMLRDVLIGKTTATDDQIRERAAQLGLNREEQSALAEYAIANAKINAATLKQTAGAGSVSDAEQRANREMNVDPTKIPAMGAYNAMAQSQFEGDKARYKADWAANHPATNALQLDKAWRKESQQLTEMYTNIAKERIKFIVDNGSSAQAVKEAYKRYPIPEYDPATEKWKKTKPLAQILGR